MREIKFRAWDTKEKSMCEWNELRTTQLFEDGINGKDCILMQYTGLKDKHGKMIFEGDIVHYQARNWDWKMEVVFDDGAFCLKRQGNYYEIGEGEIRSCDTFEVIGDIFTTPKLLKD